MLFRIQLENIGLFPTILTAFHDVLPVEQNCIYGIYFYGISKQSSLVASVILWWENTNRFRGEYKKNLIKRSKPERKAETDSMALLWHALFMIKMSFCSHINSNGEEDILP